MAVEDEAALEPEYEPAYEPELEPALQQAAEPASVPDFVPLAAVAAAKPRRQAIAEPATAGKGKAAFTLRLDPSRHLK
ncbi:hypothetical protein ACSNOK_33645, partial [Streptomyces sp. URMC 126]